LIDNDGQVGLAGAASAETEGVDVPVIQGEMGDMEDQRFSA
jgi:hypothetical protein